MNNHLIGFQGAYRRVAEEDKGRTLKLNGNLGVAGCHPLAGPQIERHSRPSPIINEQLDGDKGFGL